MSNLENSENKKVFAVPMMIYATAYVIAEDQESAFEKAKEISNRSLEVKSSHSDVLISGKKYDDPNLPEVSLSPAMTIGDPDPDEAMINQVYPDA